MKNRLAGFTLIEMMVSLSLFAVAMLAITNLLSTSMRLMKGIVGADENRTQAVLFSRILDSVVRDSWELSQHTNGTLYLNGFSGQRYTVYRKGPQLYLEKSTGSQPLSQKVFTLDSAAALRMEAVETAGRKAVRLFIDLPGQDINKVMLLGYKKGEISHE